MVQILLLEDEQKTAEVLKRGLEENGFAVDIATDGMAGLELTTHKNYSLIISDLIMPRLGGLEFSKRIRAAGHETPILMLTALGTTDDLVLGFESGADDYLSKPFAFKELLVRAKALLKRAKPLAPLRMLQAADLTVNVDARIATRAGRAIDLTPKEFALLEYFLVNKNRVLSKKELARDVWKINFDTGTNMVEVYVNYLRNKIDRDFEPKLLHTQFGHGYILKDQS
jgi:two-component system, OmpR family, copper resistance phosphate regulon response regulator CusR